MTEAKNSPLPWAKTGCYIKSDGGAGPVIVECYAEEDAAFIVLATSLHHELVAALEEAIRHLEDAQSGFIPMCGSDEAWTKKQGEIIADARAVLAKAKQP